jgi:predicted dithiol-disulfide oxidoreductase (DUF899 family)
MAITFPGETSDYRAARDRLPEREIGLRRLTEEVAEARLTLHPGGAIPDDYTSHEEGPDGQSGRRGCG